MCLSQKEDDLSQWRGYGDDAKGICIGFNYKALREIDSLFTRKSTNENNAFMKLEQIDYSLDFVMELFERIFHSYTKENPTTEDIEETFKESFISSFRDPFYKHPAFEAEEEWRIVYSKIDTDKECTFHFDLLNQNEKFAKNFHLEKLAYKINNGQIVSHIELGIPNILNVIDKIYIGPKCKATKEDINSLIKYYFNKDFENAIFNSKAYSYR